MRLNFSEIVCTLAITLFLAVIVAESINQRTVEQAAAAAQTASHPLTPDEMIAYAERQGREFDPEASSIFINGEHVQTVIRRAWDYDQDRYYAFLDAGHAPHENLDAYYSDLDTEEAIASIVTDG